MISSSLRNSAVALSSAACLLTPQIKAAPPEMLAPEQTGEGPQLLLKVEHDIADEGSLNVQFSDDLRTWRSAVDCGCLEKVGSSWSDLDPTRMQSHFVYNPEISSAQRFFQALISSGSPIEYQLYGLNFSPYIDPDENPNRNVAGQITEAELRERLERIAPYTEWVRSFGVNEDLQPIGRIAHELGLKAAVGAWIGPDAAENQRQIDRLVELAKQGHVDLAIVGSESILRGDVSSTQLIEHLNDVRGQLRAAGVTIPVATADVYGSFLNHPELFSAVDVVLPNIYPYWEGLGVGCAVAYLDRSYNQLKTAAGDLPIIISETGWPTCGNRFGEAVPSLENAVDYLLTFISWAKLNQVPYWAFTTYDEGWKVTSEGPQGACWGIWNGTGELKPGMEILFSGTTVPEDVWRNCGSGEPVVDIFTSPDFVKTNLKDFLVSGAANPGDEVRLNGVPLTSSQINESGSFAAVVPLAAGTNNIEVAVYPAGAAEPSVAVTKLVEFDPAFSTASKRLLYVDIAEEAGAVPAALGTVVIDLDGNAILGIMPDRHVRGVSPANDELYFEDRTVWSSAHHAELRTLPFSYILSVNTFTVSPSGLLLSRGEIVDMATNQKLPDSPANITTGSSWAGAQIPGGPAATPDGSAVFYGNSVSKLDLATGGVTPTGFSGDLMSDITVSPDNRLVAVSSYSFSQGRVNFYDANTFELLGTAQSIGDFSGEVDFVAGRAVVGSTGNPSYGGGYVSVIDTNSFAVLSQLRSPLADNLAVSPNGEIFAAVGLESDGVLPSRQGVDVYVISEDGQVPGELKRVKTFFLGMNRWVSTMGRPVYDQIREIVYKPAAEEE